MGYMTIAYVTSAYVRGVLVSFLINLMNLSRENLSSISILTALVGQSWTSSMPYIIQMNANFAGKLRSAQRDVQIALRLTVSAAN